MLEEPHKGLAKRGMSCRCVRTPMCEGEELLDDMEVRMVGRLIARRFNQLTVADGH